MALNYHLAIVGIKHGSGLNEWMVNLPRKLLHPQILIYLHLSDYL